jgi:ribonuclease Z
MRISMIGLGLLLVGCAHAPLANQTITSSSSPVSVSTLTPPTAPTIKIVVLGSGTPVPSRTQVGAAILIQAGNKNLLFDCGRGCTSRLAQYNPSLIPEVDKLFLTHLHSDHVVGIPDLWLNGWTQGRLVPLKVWGPEGTDTMMEGLRRAFAVDIEHRTANATSDPLPIQRAVTTMREDGVVYDEDGIQVMAFKVVHGDMAAFGFKVAYQGQSVLISGDTTVAPGLVANGVGVDVALMEVASPQMVQYVQRTFNPAQAQVILGLHLNADQAASVFSAIKPKLGVYYHTVSNCNSNQSLLAQTRSTYNGRLEVSQDLMEINVFSDRVESVLPPNGIKC